MFNRHKPKPEGPEAGLDEEGAAASVRTAMARALKQTSGKAEADDGFADALLGAIAVIETAVLAIDLIDERLRDIADLVGAARETGDEGRRALFAERYDEVRAEIDNIALGAMHDRVGLIGDANGAYEIPLNRDGRAQVAIPFVDLTARPSGLDLPAPASAFADDAELDGIEKSLQQASETTGRAAAILAEHAAVIAGRMPEGGRAFIAAR